MYAMHKRAYCYKKLNISDIERYIGNISLYCFFVLTGYIALVNNEHTSFLVRWGSLLIGSSIGWHYALCIKKLRSFLSIFTTIMLLGYITCYIFQENVNYSIKDFLRSLCYIGMSVLLLKNQFSTKIALMLYYAIVGIVLLKICYYGSVNFVILTGSRNYISVLLMFFLFFYYVTKYKSGKEWSLLPAISFFILSVVAIGRGGILTSGFLLLSLLFYKLRGVRYGYKKYFYVLIIIFMCLFLVFIVDIADLFPRFQSNGVVDGARLTIWQTYLNNNLSSIKDFIFSSGVELATKERWRGNLHNSFLQAYASFGLLFFIVLICTIVSSFVKGVKNKKYLYCILFIGLILRSFTDKLFFTGYCEIYLYFFILSLRTHYIKLRRINHGR